MLGGLGFGSVVPQPSSVVLREKLAAFDSGINSESTVPARSRARGLLLKFEAWSLACGDFICWRTKLPTADVLLHSTLLIILQFDFSPFSKMVNHTIQVLCAFDVGCVTVLLWWLAIQQQMWQ